MECMIGRYKTECIRTTVFHNGPYRTIGEVEFATAGWVDWYDNRRLHSMLGMMTPVEFDQAHYATLNREPQSVWERRRTWGASLERSTGGRTHVAGTRSQIRHRPTLPDPACSRRAFLSCLAR